VFSFAGIFGSYVCLAFSNSQIASTSLKQLQKENLKINFLRRVYSTLSSKFDIGFFRELGLNGYPLQAFLLSLAIILIALKLFS